MAHDTNTGVRVWTWSRLDNAQEIRRLLLPADHADADVILGAYLRWGVDLPNHLSGDFSVCVYDPRDRSIHAFRDPIGIRPLTMARTGTTTVVTTAPGVLWGLPGLVSTPAQQMILEHAVQLRNLSMSAAHPQARRVTPGTILTRREGVETESRYHRFDPHPQWLNRPDNRWVRDFRESLDSAVSARIPAAGPIGLEFSGGLDSVGIATLIKDLDANSIDRVRAFAYMYFTNEEATIRAAAEALGITALELGITPEGRERTLAVESLLGEPVAHEMSMRFTRALAQCAHMGGSAIFSGHGGDQAASHFAQVAPHEWFTRRRYLGAFRYALPQRGWRRKAGVARVAVRGMQFKPFPLPSHVELAHTLHLRPEVLQAGGIIDQLKEHYQPLNAPSVNADIVTAEGLVQPVTATYWSRRAEESNTVASLFGMTYEFPLLDPAVVQQFLSTPTVHKYRNGLGRYLFREALGPTMPASVRWAPTKYMGPAIPKERKPRPVPDSIVHPLLAELMPTGALLPPRSHNWGNPYGVHRVNMWLTNHFPDA